MVREKLPEKTIDHLCAAHALLHELEDYMVAVEEGVVSAGYLRKLAAELVSETTRLFQTLIEEACHGVGSE